MSMLGQYDPLLVALSVGIAMLASFTALNLAGRLCVSEGQGRAWWLVAAALALGGGIWSMHFVGMLAFIMPMPASYDVDWTLLSLAAPILVSGAGLAILSHFGSGWRPLLASGVLAAAGIVSMHYIGMGAMRMPGVAVSYDGVLVAASVAIALIAATAALWLAFRTKGTGERLVAAVVMGFAIAGMHYTGMAAADFRMTDHAEIGGAPAIEPGVMAFAVAAATSVLLMLALLTAFFDRKLSALTAREAAALKQSEERYRALIENASDIIAVLDRDGNFIYESSSARHILGFGTEEIIGRQVTDFVPAEKVADVRRFLRRVAQSPGEATPGELAMLDKHGIWRELEVVGKNLLDEPSIEGIVLNLRDITERKRLMAQLEQLSISDMLTGILNRRGFMQRAEIEMEKLRRNGEHLVIVMIDIDHFKRVNDTYGHAAGDLVLAMVAGECRTQLRVDDVLARFGGEEFVILLSDAAGDDSPRAVVERLRQAISGGRVSTIKGEVSVTASFGLATVDPRRADLETALRLADEALYEAKRAGRNCVKIRA